MPIRSRGTPTCGSEGRLDLAALITQQLPLEQKNDVFAGMAKGAVVRAVLVLN